MAFALFSPLIHTLPFWPVIISDFVEFFIKLIILPPLPIILGILLGVTFTITPPDSFLDIGSLMDTWIVLFFVTLDILQKTKSLTLKYLVRSVLCVSTNSSTASDRGRKAV